MDHARSSDAAVQAQLDRLTVLSPGGDVLGLERITALLAALGDPHRALPRVLHVAGTNGKGSTCAFLRAGLEAAGYRVHAYTSPHLVRFNERIRVAGSLIDDAMLAPLLGEVLDAAEARGIAASFFEVTTAVAFLAFARVPADACVIEVGLGGRLDATNVVRPIVCGIAQLGIDHQAFLGETDIAIAREKAGIAKRAVPLVTMAYPPHVAEAVDEVAAAAGARIARAGDEWHWQSQPDGIAYRDGEGGLELPRPAMIGTHQSANCALATAMLRHQPVLAIPDAAYAAMSRAASWPARMQLLADGPLTRLLPTGSRVRLDGGHNASAGEALAEALGLSGEDDAPLTIVAGMLSNKDPIGLLGPVAKRATRMIAVPVPGHDCHAPERLAMIASEIGIADVVTAADIPAALRAIATRGETSTVLICGSLYLAGEVLAANDEAPK